MTASKDLQEHRPASHGGNSRSHAHSVSLGSSYRVNRRKSSSATLGVNMAALAAAANDASLESLPQRNRSRPASQGDMLRGLSGDNRLSANISSNKGVSSLQGAGFNGSSSSSALVDGPPLSTVLGSDKPGSKARARRASEGSRLIRERRRSTNGELRCETCGKSYKHGSCLTKHLWEHTPEWNLTSKLLISKHQQVQLLEAASVLVNMNHDKAKSNENAVQGDSDNSYESPAASGSSDVRDDDMSSRTSTPSQQDETTFYADNGKPIKNQPYRQNSYSSAHSYQSTSGTSLGPSSVPNESHEFGLSRPSGGHRRPSSASYYEGNEDVPEVIAAAEGLLRCSLGSTPKHHSVQLPPDVPPVPPLPAKFRHNQARPLSSDAIRDVQMAEAGLFPGRGEVEDDGFFGRMEQVKEEGSP